MKPEQYFLKYGYPCAQMLLQLREINQATLNKLEKHALNNEPMDKKELESIFTEAFRRIKKIAIEMKKDPWDIEVIKEYFLRGKHNCEIDAGDKFYAKAPQALKELCKVKKAKIIKKGKDHYVVEFNKKTRVVSNQLLSDANINDTVTIHYGYAVEKI